MTIAAFSPVGFEGRLVYVEVDIRRGIPGVDIVGLPDNAVREARDRVRIALRNSGYSMPVDRVLINLAPAGVRKEGAGYDLAIALGLLAKSGQANPVVGAPVLVMGELELSGTVRPVTGVLPAAALAVRNGIERFVVPATNAAEARSLKKGVVYPVGTLRDAVRAAEGCEGAASVAATAESRDDADPDEDFADIKGHPFLRRALEVAVAGRHNVLLFGPPYHEDLVARGKTRGGFGPRHATALPYAAPLGVARGCRGRGPAGRSGRGVPCA
jgi:magnesium chelatase family protein